MRFQPFGDGEGDGGRTWSMSLKSPVYIVSLIRWNMQAEAWLFHGEKLHTDIPRGHGLRICTVNTLIHRKSVVKCDYGVWTKQDIIKKGRKVWKKSGYSRLNLLSKETVYVLQSTDKGCWCDVVISTACNNPHRINNRLIVHWMRSNPKRPYSAVSL